MSSSFPSVGNRYGLGIDTGGTFTDAAIVDLSNHRVLAKAKAPTTYQDLSKGIDEAVLGVLRASVCDVEDIKLVGMSTTIATNSILQGKGGRVGLIGIGWKPQEDWVLGCDKSAFVRGGHDSVGSQTEPLDENETVEAVRHITAGVDAAVVSGIFSIYNPTHELRVKRMISDRAPIPVVLGHTLTGDLGIMERTVTAVLNARLIPIMGDFMTAAERSLRSKGIEARIMVFKGDGGLMSLEAAKERPIETILSGPAASLVGGSILAGLDHCIVLDIGGTSTDIAFMDKGFPRLNKEGAMVGGWRTRVKAIDIWTTGLGGDSIVFLDSKGEIRIGPERVIPLAIASEMSPSFRRKIESSSDTGLYVACRDVAAALTENEAKVLRFLNSSGPSTLYEIMDGVSDVVLTSDVLQSLKTHGYVLRTGLTPTDVMHIAGSCDLGDVECSRIGARLVAEKSDVSADEFVDNVMERVITRVGEEIMLKIILDEVGSVPRSEALDRLLEAGAGEKRFQSMDITVKIDRPIVGIGAPAKALVEPLDKRMNVKTLIPDNYEVGNAVGAVCSLISESVSVQVYPKDYKYIVFAPGTTPIDYSHLEEALTSAKTYAERCVRERVEASEAEDVRVKIEVLEHRFADGYGKEMKFLNWVEVRAIATGRPNLRGW
ncbi:MAG: hydantoinase/oxoprolinase family protein [Methanomassiliicoccales archaeon]|jgi:N-methylhydantoinase A/oxoprolinase/acetone carboxylase beta subunit